MSGITPTHFSPNTLQALQRIDTNHNGVSIQELKQLDTDNDGQLSPTEGSAAGMDTSNLNEINQQLRAHSSEPNRVVFSTARMTTNTAAERMLNVFSRVDGDNDGFLSRSELNTALHSTSYTGADAAAVASMYNGIEHLEEFADDEWGDENDGVTRQDIRAMVAQSGDPVREATNIAMGWGERKINQTRTLFPNGLNSVRSDHMRQGLLGNCSFVSAVGSIAQTPAGRQRLHDMIQDNHNGTYTVTFPGQNPVTINSPTDAERASYATAGADGLWLSVLEKGAAQVRHDTTGSSNENPYLDIASMSMDDAMALLTGHSTDTDDLSFTSFATLRSKLTSTLGAGRSVTAGIRHNMPFKEPRRENGLPMGHAYTVINFNAATDQITLRNPWGNGEPQNASGQAADGADDGTFTMSLTDFNTYFSMITYEQDH